jgi:hypothetical protein
MYCIAISDCHSCYSFMANIYIIQVHIYSFLKPKTIFDYVNFFSVQGFSVLEKTTYENILLVEYILIIYI